MSGKYLLRKYQIGEVTSVMAVQSTTINVAKDFSKFPAGRFNDDGDYSGQRFRDQLLVSAFFNAKMVTVELDGTAGYGSSFLEEAFGGLVRVKNFKADDLHRRLALKSEDTSLISEIWEYIDHPNAN